MKHVVSFSGGKDSTAMLLMMIERKMPIDYILYVDTTKDFPGMYKHIEQVANYIKPLEITRLSFDFDYWFGERTITKGKRKGETGYGWADFRNRWCTRLKIWTISKFLKDIDVIEYHGIAYDEQRRAKNKDNRIIKYPHIDWKITEKQALNYCYEKGFDWSDLYEKMDRVSCYLCPLARLGQLKTVYTEFPNLWEDMKRLDNKSFRKFRNDYTLNELEKKFDREIKKEN